MKRPECSCTVHKRSPVCSLRLRNVRDVNQGSRKPQYSFMAMSSRPEANYLKYSGVGIMKNEINTTETNLRLKVIEDPFNHAAYFGMFRISKTA